LLIADFLGPGIAALAVAQAAGRWVLGAGLACARHSLATLLRCALSLAVSLPSLNTNNKYKLQSEILACCRLGKT
jgi:hypothetical protein